MLKFTVHFVATMDVCFKKENSCFKEGKLREASWNTQASAGPLRTVGPGQPCRPRLFEFQSLEISSTEHSLNTYNAPGSVLSIK